MKPKIGLLWGVGPHNGGKMFCFLLESHFRINLGLFKMRSQPNGWVMYCLDEIVHFVVTLYLGVL